MSKHDKFEDRLADLYGGDFDPIGTTEVDDAVCADAPPPSYHDPDYTVQISHEALEKCDPNEKVESNPRNMCSRADQNLRLLLTDPFSTDNAHDDRGKPLVGGVLNITRTLWVGLTNPTDGAAVGRATFLVKGTRWGLPYKRRFSLAPGQHVGMHGDGFAKGVQVIVIASSFEAVARVQAVASASEFQLPDAIYSRALLLEEAETDLVNPLGNIIPVPDGAQSVIPTAPLASFDWINFDTAGTLVTLAGPVAAGVESDIRGTHFRVGTTADLLWKIAL